MLAAILESCAYVHQNIISELVYCFAKFDSLDLTAIKIEGCRCL